MPGRFGDRAGHREDAVDDDQLAGALRRLFEKTLEIRHVVVTELADVAEREAAAVDNGGAIFAVAEDDVALADDGGDGAEVRLEAGREDESGFLVQELRKAAFQLFMEFQRAVEEARARAGRAEFFRDLHRGVDDAGVVGEAEVVVRPDHDHVPPVDARPRRLVRGERPEAMGTDPEP
jgi:hypothetical protein